MYAKNHVLTAQAPVPFDAANADHRKAYVEFLNTGRWPIKFELEVPFTSIPSMAMFKLAARAVADVGEIDEPKIFAKATAPLIDIKSANASTLEKVA